MEMLFSVYEAQHNSDMTEGKGRMVTFLYTQDLEEAVASVQGKGVMGVGTGSVVETKYFVDHAGIISKQTERLYGYRIDLAGRWGYGYIDNRDAPVDDPEFQEFLRLKQKFDKRP